jgi:hypothetical protein
VSTPELAEPNNVKLLRSFVLSDLSVSRNYRCDPYLNIAEQLQRLGEEKGIATLAALAGGSESEQIIILCRMLFVAKPGGRFRRPELGVPNTFGSTEMADWPLEPIEVVDGVPFLITTGYSIAGSPEHARGYLNYCRSSCNWNPYKYGSKTAQEKSIALQKLIEKHKLVGFDREFLANQIR